MQNFPKNNPFLPPGTHMYICVSGDKKCLSFGKFSVCTKLMNTLPTIRTAAAAHTLMIFENNQPFVRIQVGGGH